jgi:arylsulfatase
VKRVFSSLVAVGLGVAALACPGRAPEPKAAPAVTAPRPAGNGWNVLLLTIDTLRADHLGAYGYARPTSPELDALAARGTLFEQAYTYWPKTRGSFVMIHTGRHPSLNGYSKHHPMLLDFNPTLASTLAEAGYDTAAVVDNPNVAASLGYAKGFASYRETWEEKDLATEMDRTRAITAAGVSYLQKAPAGKPFFLWLHYVNPHAPYDPPPPYDTAFMDAASRSGPALEVVSGFHGGIPKQWAMPGRRKLSEYVALYDGEIATVDAEVGRVLQALERSPHAGRTLIVVTSDHGESLGENDYYFDHGEDVFDPSLRIPLLVVAPGAPAGVRVAELASTLDLVPTVLDAVKVSYPADLAGRSLLAAVNGERAPARARLDAQNDRNLSATFDATTKVVATPGEAGQRYELYARARGSADEKKVTRERPDELRQWRRELELFLEARDREWAATRRKLQGRSGDEKLSPEACENLKALGYVVAGCS